MAAQVHFRSLFCEEQNDFTGADSVSLLFDGELIWGPHSMKTGEEDPIGEDRFFARTATVSLWEHDEFDPDDHLGDITISESEVNTGERAQQFTEGAKYTLFYFVTR